MEQGQILIIGDDLSLYSPIQKRMMIVGVDVCFTEPSAEMLIRLKQQEYRLIVIDIRTFDQEYLELIRQIRKEKSTPILALSPLLSPEDKLRLLLAGANAFIEEPFDIDVCIVQAYALLHLYVDEKINGHREDIVYGTELMISLHYRQVIIDGKLLKLTRKEFDLFRCFASHPGQVFSCEQLYCLVWDEDIAVGSEDTVKSHIKTLRKKLASVGKYYIDNVWGIGYKFVLEPEK